MTTITYEQLQAILQAPCTDTRNAALADAGITIADPEPPEAMVKLAREIAEQAMKGGFYSADASGYRCAGAEAALAALPEADAAA